MQVTVSQLAGGDHNADRVLVTDNAVLVLDGATAFEPVPVGPGEYAETLGHEVARRITIDPAGPLPDAVAEGISTTARAFDLRPGRSPSSTISILRLRDDLVDLYVLGDSPIYYGIGTATRTLADNRLAEIGRTQLAHLVSAARTGHGSSEEHRAALAVLQRAQRRLRNIQEGYWIAESDPAAAQHAITRTVSLSEVRWAVLGTDGATNHIDATSSNLWASLVTYDAHQLDELLAAIHRWERDIDPDGRQRPRAKRHDDKTLAVVSQLVTTDDRD